ncbi:hypothetical protein NQ315_011770 [Exocentrus adspersus]|uniref:PWWP domain-containing protein n=1 Tax=Exocentrus adspersus TaxID=1586481 RepID=A0AAV8W1C1_9CUCU|nr:hypothetical protein NQ315_011770 [Exocentrus adspersus]
MRISGFGRCTSTNRYPVCTSKKKRGRKKQQDVTPKAQEAVPTLSDFVVDNRVSETVTLPLVTKRSRGRPRKINNEEVSKAPVEAVIVKQAPNTERKRGHSGRGRRRESVDDMDLLKRYNRHYKEQLKRSKSITRTMQEIKRKPYHWVPHEDNTRVLDRYRKLCRKRAGSPAWDTEDEDGAWDTRTRLGRARSQARDTEDEDDAWYKRNRLSRARSQIRDMEDEDEEAWNKRTRLGRARSQARDTEDEDESLWEKRRRSSRGHSQTRDTEDEYEDVAWEKRTRSRSQARDTEDEDISLEKRTRLRRASSQARDSEDENNAEAKDELNIPNQSESATSKNVAQIADVEVKEMRLGRAGSQARDTEDEDESLWEKRRRSSRGHSQARDTEDEDVAREKKTRLRRACSQPRESENENNAKIRRGSPQARDTIINELNISNQSVSATSKSVEQIVDVQDKEAKEMRSDGNTDVDDERIRCVKNFEDCLAGRSSFNVGDIVWGQIGTYPFWPCMIMKDPGTSLHKKKFRGKYCQREMYHVRFFGDRGRRAWINKQQIMLYSSRRDLDVLEDLMKSEHKPASYMYVVKGNAVKKWKCAVDEAEQLKLKDFNEKISFFDELFRKTTSSQPKERKDDKLQKEASSKSNSPKQKPVIEHVTGDSALEIASSESTRRSSDGQVEEKTEWSPGIGETSSKKCKLFMSGDASFCEELSISVQDPNSTLKSEDIPQTSLEKKQSDEISEIGSKASSDNATISDMPLNTMEAQKALYKRNNLFRGVSREKVCQYCFKPGGSVKVQGRGGPKKSKKKRFVIKNENSFNESSALNESLPIVISPKKPCRDMAEEEQVQIITVPSSVYNTPPRKTFPPNFKHMTLAEQIDYKMKEIMKKFESKTVYSVVETIPDATSRVQPLTNITDTDAEKQIPPPEISTRINNELVNTGRLSGGKPKPSSKKRLFFKHVTADSIVELDDIKVEDEEKRIVPETF